MQENVQPELLLALRSHGIAAEEDNGLVVVADAGLRFESRVTDISSDSGMHTVRVDVVVHSTRLGPKPVVEAFAAVGDTREKAIAISFSRFLLGTFHTLIECLAGHSCEEAQADRFPLEGTQARWDVFCGPTISQSQPEDDAISEQCARFFEALQPLLAELPGGESHWVRIFVCAFHGEVQAMEVLLDNEPWPQAQEIGGSWDWVTPQSYASARVFALALAA